MAALGDLSTAELGAAGLGYLNLGTAYFMTLPEIIDLDKWNIPSPQPYQQPLKIASY